MNLQGFSLSDYPILHRELTRAARRPWLYILGYGFAAFHEYIIA